MLEYNIFNDNKSIYVLVSETVPSVRKKVSFLVLLGITKCNTVSFLIMITVVSFRP